MKMIYHYADQQWISIAPFDLHLKLRRKTQREKKDVPQQSTAVSSQLSVH